MGVKKCYGRNLVQDMVVLKLLFGNIIITQTVLAFILISRNERFEVMFVYKLVVLDILWCCIE